MKKIVIPLIGLVLVLIVPLTVMSALAQPPPEIWRVGYGLASLKTEEGRFIGFATIGISQFHMYITVEHHTFGWVHIIGYPRSMTAVPQGWTGGTGIGYVAPFDAIPGSAKVTVVEPLPNQRGLVTVRGDGVLFVGFISVVPVA